MEADRLTAPPEWAEAHGLWLLHSTISQGDGLNRLKSIPLLASNGLPVSFYEV
jgi:hypothetical protein